MPVTSKSQAGLMGMVSSGKKKLPGMGKAKAKEFLRGVDVKKLPEHADMENEKEHKMPGEEPDMAKMKRKRKMPTM